MSALSAGLVALGYLCGSIPFGLLLTRWLKKTDVRQLGSGNIGATNVSRVAGKRLGLVVLVLDVMKGAGPIMLARVLLLDAQGVHACVGLAAFLGHVFPVWLRFRGGKGVATALGVMLVLLPQSAALGFGVYGLVFLATRLSSAGSLLGGISAVVAAWLSDAPRAYAWLSVVLVALLVFTHRQNIRRLLLRTENRA